MGGGGSGEGVACRPSTTGRSLIGKESEGRMGRRPALDYRWLHMFTTVMYSSTHASRV